MTSTQTLSLPMILPTGPDCARCVDRLTTELTRIKGVQRAEVAQDLITVEFDPDSVTLSRIESEAKRAGAGIAAKIEHRTDLQKTPKPKKGRSGRSVVGTKRN